MALKYHFIEKSVFHDAYVHFLGVLSENIVQYQKTFFLCLVYIYTFPIASFYFFCELVELGAKLGLQRALFRSWPTELGSKPNSKSLIDRKAVLDQNSQLARPVQGLSLVNPPPTMGYDRPF